MVGHKKAKIVNTGDCTVCPIKVTMNKKHGNSRKIFHLYFPSYMHITAHACLHNSFKAHGLHIQMAYVYGESCYLLAANLAALNLLTGRVCVVGSGSDGSPAVCSSTSPNTYKTVITM